jgi:uncharacterized RDD family membrane protein YckC
MKERAGFLRRFPALVLDAAIILLLVFPFGRPASGFLSALGVHMSSIDTNAGALGAFLFYSWAIAIFYLLIEAATGATPGKLIMRLKVAGPDGNPASWGRRLGRYVGKLCFLLIIPPLGMTEVELLVYPFLVVGLAAFLGTLLIFGPEKQTFYDRLTRTAVIKRGRPR